MAYQLNTNLDTGHWAAEYRHDLRCRVKDLLAPPAAADIAQSLTHHARFRQAHIANGEYREISREEFSALPPAARQQLVREVYDMASRGVGFWYGRHGLDSNTAAPLDKLVSWLNSEPLLEQVREITGIQELASTSAQATSFSPGDFLTRHRDDVTSEGRRVAFVLNLTEHWHPDWGGLLQFFEDSGATREAWSPEFNSLCLFDVKHVHSVTTVAPFAPRVRLAISGWFHDRKHN
ncbi:2OG-Fe(II) oxygenase family protein [Microbulbifer sp. YPW16]|uniref:2OG-Fe(II) oxygenase family protein n=1 Tax=Microbulbifer sp. YPW16 TaxID=2904242 RepID=UPI001E3AD715|nr:2OG-Fe(II) oxygenase family protein [Microbulbifer sp. YPW16]UHQ54732.1 2OG-Fe(II) oxygenase [Microbulbifer sp. YPW16]